MQRSLFFALLILACTAKKSTNSSDDSRTSSDSGTDVEDADEVQTPADHPAVLDSLADKIALAHYKNFETRSTAMVDAAQAFCESPSDALLEEVRSAWWSARTPWKNAEIVQFGPITEYPERVGPKVDDWPVNERAVEDRLVSDDDLTLEAYRNYGTATRGLPVAEYLLWGAGEETLSLYGADSRRCEMLVVVSEDIHASASYLVDLWSVDWYDQLRGQDDGDWLVFKEPKDVVDEWVNHMVFTAENIRETKLGKPAGDRFNGTPQPDLLESRSSARSLQDAMDALVGVQQVWSGDLDGDHPGIRDLVLDDPDLVGRVDSLFADTITRLDDIPETLEDTVWDQPEIVDRAQTALAELQKILQIEVAAHIGIVVGFNPNDGD